MYNLIVSLKDGNYRVYVTFSNCGHPKIVANIVHNVASACTWATVYCGYMDHAASRTAESHDMVNDTKKQTIEAKPHFSQRKKQ